MIRKSTLFLLSLCLVFSTANAQSYNFKDCTETGSGVTLSVVANVNGKASYSGVGSFGNYVLSWSASGSRWELKGDGLVMYFNTANSAQPPQCNVGVTTFTSTVSNDNGWQQTNEAFCGTLDARSLKLVANNVTLPVELSSFTAKLEMGIAKLSWEVKSETDNREFIIYRSDDQNVFSEIGRVVSGDIYVFYDRKPLPGMNYYKLSQRDNDGREKELAIRELRFGISGEAFQAYPNPSGSMVYLSCADASLWGSTAILADLNGRELARLKVASRQELDLMAFPKGVYLVKYTNGKTLKLIKE